MTLDEAIILLQLSHKEINKASLIQAKRNALKKYHPDLIIRTGLSFNDAHLRTIKITEAFELLNTNIHRFEKIILPNFNRNHPNNSTTKRKSTPKKEIWTPRKFVDDKLYFLNNHVLWIKYIYDEEILIVNFEGNSLYLYESVPLHIYQDYTSASNPGRYQHYKISYTYKYRRIKSEFNWDGD